MYVQHSLWVQRPLYWAAKEIGSGMAQLQYGTSYPAPIHYNPLYQSLIHELDHHRSNQYTQHYSNNINGFVLSRLQKLLIRLLKEQETSQQGSTTATILYFSRPTDSGSTSTLPSSVGSPSSSTSSVHHFFPLVCCPSSWVATFAHSSQSHVP